MCVVESQRQLLIQRRGATLALTAIARDTGTDLQEKLPSFWDAMFASVTVVSGKVIYSRICCFVEKIFIRVHANSPQLVD